MSAAAGGADSGTSWQHKYVDVIPHTTAGPRASGFVGFRPGTLSANFRDGGRRVWLHSRHHGNQLLLSPVCFPGTFLLTQSLTRTVPSRLLQQSQLRPGGCVSTKLRSRYTPWAHDVTHQTIQGLSADVTTQHHNTIHAYLARDCRCRPATCPFEHASRAAVAHACHTAVRTTPHGFNGSQEQGLPLHAHH